MPIRIGGFDTTDIGAGKGGGGAGITHFPFEITVTNDKNLGLYATVRPGTITNILPDNIFENFYLSAGTFYLKLQMKGNGNSITSANLFLDNNPKITDQSAGSNSPPPVASIIIGIIIVTSDSKGNLQSKILQIISYNLIATPKIIFYETKIPNTPGEEPFNRWWRWNITSDNFSNFE